MLYSRKVGMVPAAGGSLRLKAGHGPPSPGRQATGQPLVGWFWPTEA